MIKVENNIITKMRVLIEISKDSDNPIKYEMDEGKLVVDRFMQTSMRYPCNYGFIENTLGGDGDPLDVLVVSDYGILPGAYIDVVPVGYLMMTDESGEDEKILAVPFAKVHPMYKDINSYKQLPEMLLKRIEHFFMNYKALDPGKWAKVDGWYDKAEADALIIKSIQSQ